MNSGNKHTLSAFDEDMDNIRALISEMGSRAESAVEGSMKALMTNDVKLAKKIRNDDKIIDRLEDEVERIIVQTIALRAPMADDLRELIAAIKICAVIERIGDYSKNIARRVGKLKTEEFLIGNNALQRMGEITTEMVHMAMEAYAKRNIDLAIAVTRRDDDVDQLYKELFVDFVGYIAKHPEAAQEVAHLLFISKNLERIGDHSTTCAGMIYFTETGENLADD